MGYYAYKIRNNRGDLSAGTVEAATLEDASRQLRSDGNFIVKLDPANSAQAKSVKSVGGKVKREQVITFAHQISVMVDTGVPISEALQCVAEQSDSPKFRAILAEIASTVESGGELSSALAMHPKVFPPIMISLIKASEVSGTMGPMLDRISKYLSKEQQTVKKIKSALTYPAVMLTMILAVTIGLLVWVLPRFAGIFESKGAALPLPTQLLMTLSNTLIGGWYWWIAGVVGVIVGIVIMLKTDAGRQLFDRLKLSSPIFGTLFSKLYTTRSTRTMGVMINAGVPILDMIAIVREVTTNAQYEKLWDRADEQLRRGAQLSDVLFDSPLIPKTVAQMIFAGEKAGRMGPTMEKIAEFTEQEFDEQVKTTTNYIEPLMVAIMGGIVGFVAIALLLPIFTVSAVVSG
jgi:type IV pilus assembly protein PilC